MGHSIEVRLTISGKHLMFLVFLQATVVLKAMVLAKASCNYLQKQITQFFFGAETIIALISGHLSLIRKKQIIPRN